MPKFVGNPAQDGNLICKGQKIGRGGDRGEERKGEERKGQRRGGDRGEERRGRERNGKEEERR